MTTVLKLGGSVITKKDRAETVDDAALERVAGAVGDALAGDGGVTDLVLVHGAGSFGHHYAAQHGVSTTAGTHEATAIREIHSAMTTLNDAVLDALADNGVRGLPVQPLSSTSRDADATLDLPATNVERMLAEGFVPVLHGDMIAHDGKGATVLSGDEIILSLARALEADRVGLCSTVPGVLDDEGAVIPTVSSFDDVADVLGGSEATDVTGGMAGKVRTLLSLSAPATIFGADDLSGFLAGENPGTLVESE